VLIATQRPGRYRYPGPVPLPPGTNIAQGDARPVRQTLPWPAACICIAAGLICIKAGFRPFGNTGGRVGVDQGASTSLYVPSGYASGAPISSSSTWNGQTLAGLGLTPGTYVFDYGDCIPIGAGVSPTLDLCGG